jgi:catechol 2,3-dioxygenase-like lactoylglutathione lyase family enzyme
MLKKIDCVMIYVDRLEPAVAFYSRVLGLRPLWRDERSVGMGFPQTDAEIVLHNDASLPTKVDVHYLVDDVEEAVAHLRNAGCAVLVEPFDIAIGKCTVIRDPFDITLSILDMSRGPRPTE